MSLETLQVGRSELAKILGCSTRQVTVLEADGVIVPTVRGKAGRGSRYDLTVVVPIYINHVSAGEANTGNERDARRRRDNAQAEFVELKIRKERGNLVERVDVVQEGRSILKGIAAQIKALPRRARLAGLITTTPQETGFADLCRQVMDGMAAWKTLADVEVDEADAA